MKWIIILRNSFVGLVFLVISSILIIAIDIVILEIMKRKGIWWVFIIIGVASVLLVTSWLWVLRETLPRFQGYSENLKTKKSEIRTTQSITIASFLATIYLFYRFSILYEYSI